MVFTKNEKTLDREAQMSTKKFSIVALLEVDEENNILSSHEESHEDDVYDLVTNLIHDTDDVRLHNLVVKERQ